jgi:predicted permease
VAQVLGGEIVVGGTRKTFRRNSLVVAQVAICTLVLIGMGLCEQSLYNLRHVELGFSERNLIAAQVSSQSMGYSGLGYSGLRAREFFEQLRARITALPGVQSVTLASDLPLLGGSPDDVQNPRDGGKISVSHAVVDGNYFSTIGARILAGRGFGSQDREGGVPAVVVNRRMAELFWPGENPVGKQVRVGNPVRAMTVVGMVADSKYDDLDEAPQPFLFYALSQNELPQLNVIAKTSGNPALWSPALTGVLRDMKVPFIWAPVAFENWMNLTLFQQRAVAACVAGLAALGLLLALVGLFGAVSWSVSERRKELGIRVALGARPPQLMRMILRQTLGTAGAGLGIGLALGAGATMAVRSQLYGIGAVEWVVLIGVSTAMLVLFAIVAWASARPWIRVSPMEAVRHS